MSLNFCLLLNFLLIFVMPQEDVQVHEEEEGPHSCYYCVHSRRSKDVMDEINQEPDCMNRLKFQSRSDLQRICTEAEPYCISTVTILNGFFTQIDRNCAPDCHQGCEEHGYGLFYTECTRCCKSELCNDYDGRLYYANVCALPSLLCLVQLVFIAAITQLLLPI